MSLLDKASLVITPNAVKAGKLYSVIPNTTLGDMDVVRATTATRVNSLGLIESVAVNVPRIDYTNGSCPSLLVEGQRTNLKSYSDYMSTLGWVRGSGVIYTENQLSPQNLNNALLAEGLTGTGLVSIGSIASNVAVTSGVTYTFSIYAKLKTVSSNNFRIRIKSNSSSTNFYTNTLLTTDSWKRVSLTVTVPIGDTNFDLSIGTLSGTIDVYLFGAQIEQGSYASSYIPTVASTVTRNADIISNNNLISKGLIINDYVLFIDITNPILGSQFILDSRDISSLRTGIIRVDGTTASVTDITGGSSLSILNVLTIGKGKMCLKRTGNVISFFANGVKCASTTTTTAGTINTLSTGVTNSTVPSYINSIVLFPTALTDTECIQLTTL